MIVSLIALKQIYLPARRRKKTAAKEENAKSILFKCVVFKIHNASRDFFVVLIVTRTHRTTYHIRDCISPQECVHCDTPLSKFGSLICYRVRAWVLLLLFFSLILAFKVYCIWLDNRSLISPRKRSIFLSCSHCLRHFSCSCFALVYVPRRCFWFLSLLLLHWLII